MKTGDYVRIEDGTYNCIGKIKRIEKTNCTNIIIDYSNDEDFDEGDYFDWNVKKSSPKIIDLIEIGDYVNGEKVEDVETFINDRPEEETRIYTNRKMLYNEDIKSIVTKEQFEEMEYKVWKHKKSSKN